MTRTSDDDWATIEVNRTTASKVLFRDGAILLTHHVLTEDESQWTVPIDRLGPRVLRVAVDVTPYVVALCRSLLDAELQRLDSEGVV